VARVGRARLEKEEDDNEDTVETPGLCCIVPGHVPSARSGPGRGCSPASMHRSASGVCFYRLGASTAG
jgi:hypothetical protein